LSLSSELLAQARSLLAKEPKRPKQASLRRAVSTAYYALFHLLAEDAARAMFGGSDSAELRVVAHRGFQHAAMKRVAKAVVARNPSETWKPLLAAPSGELELVARTFVELQEERHLADYDPARRLTRAEAVDVVERAEAAARAWTSIRKDSGPADTALRQGPFSPPCCFTIKLLENDEMAAAIKRGRMPN
jgi:uncharacterized protein (UPF0332 family)